MHVFHQINIRKWKFKKPFCSQIRIQQIAFYSIIVSSSTRQQWTTYKKMKKTNHINLLLSLCKFFFFCRHCIFNRLIGTNAVMQKKTATANKHATMFDGRCCSIYLRWVINRKLCFVSVLFIYKISGFQVIGGKGDTVFPLCSRTATWKQIAHVVHVSYCDLSDTSCSKILFVKSFCVCASDF